MLTNWTWGTAYDDNMGQIELMLLPWSFWSNYTNREWFLKVYTKIDPLVIKSQNCQKVTWGNYTRQYVSEVYQRFSGNYMRVFRKTFCWIWGTILCNPQRFLNIHGTPLKLPRTCWNGRETPWKAPERPFNARKTPQTFLKLHGNSWDSPGILRNNPASLHVHYSAFGPPAPMLCALARIWSWDG